MIRIGLVGMGFMGQQHFQVYQGLAQGEVVAVADKLAERVAAVAPSVGGNLGEAQGLDLSKQQRYGSLAEMLAAGGLDAVDLCVPTDQHAELAAAALEAGVHVICEKPMALTEGECDRMIAAARSNGRRLMVAQCIRFWPAYEKLTAMVRGGELGRVISAKFWRMSSKPTWSEGGWLLDNARSGGALLDLHVHDADFIVSLWGLPPAVLSRTANLFSVGEGSDHVRTEYLYEGFACSAEGSFAMPASYPFDMAFEVAGEKGLLRFSLGDTPNLRFFPAEGEVSAPEVSEQTGYERELGYFLACLEEEREPERVAPESAREAVRLIEAERESARRGEIVRVGG
jgi:predicted dehydrogenase